MTFFTGLLLFQKEHKNINNSIVHIDKPTVQNTAAHRVTLYIAHLDKTWIEIVA